MPKHDVFLPVAGFARSLVYNFHVLREHVLGLTSMPPGLGLRSLLYALMAGAVESEAAVWVLEDRDAHVSSLIEAKGPVSGLDDMTRWTRSLQRDGRFIR